MKFEKTENFKKVQETFESFDNKGDMFFALFNIKNDGATMFTGDTCALAEGLYITLKSGLSKDSDKEETNISTALIAAFTKLLKEDSDESMILVRTLNEMIKRDAKERIDNIKKKANQMFKEGKVDDVINAFFNAMKNVFSK